MVWFLLAVESAAGSAIWFPARFATGWQSRLLGGSVGTMATLCCYWRHCYRPMGAPQPVGGSIASTARFASHAELHGGRVVVMEHKTKISSVQNWLTDWAWQRYGRGRDDSARRSFCASGVHTGGPETGRCSFGYGRAPYRVGRHAGDGFECAQCMLGAWCACPPGSPPFLGEVLRG